MNTMIIMIDIVGAFGVAYKMNDFFLGRVKGMDLKRGHVALGEENRAASRDWSEGVDHTKGG